MIAAQFTGRSFSDTLKYHLKKIDRGDAKWLDTTFIGCTEREIMNEVNMVRMLRPKVARHFLHTSLNFPPTEDLEDEQMKTIARDYLDGMGFDRHQFAVFRHFDTGHPHLHIMVSRIGYDGLVVSDSQDYRRTEQVLRQLEKRYGLTEVKSSYGSPERGMTKIELEMIKRTQEPSAKMKVQVLLKQILDQRPALDQFIGQLEANGVTVLFYQRVAGLVSGISYGCEGLHFRGAQLGSAFKWASIKNSIGYEQERDRTAIHQANLRTKTGRPATGAAVGRTATPGEAADINALLQPGAGGLQVQIGAADLAAVGPTQRSRIKDSSAGKSAKKDDHGRGDDPEVEQWDPQQVGKAALPGGDFMRDLRNADHAAGDLAEGALKQVKRKKRRSRGLPL